MSKLILPFAAFITFLPLRLLGSSDSPSSDNDDRSLKLLERNFENYLTNVRIQTSQAKDVLDRFSSLLMVLSERLETHSSYEDLLVQMSNSLADLSTMEMAMKNTQVIEADELSAINAVKKSSLLLFDQKIREMLDKIKDVLAQKMLLFDEITKAFSLATIRSRVVLTPLMNSSSDRSHSQVEILNLADEINNLVKQLNMGQVFLTDVVAAQLLGCETFLTKKTNGN